MDPRFTWDAKSKRYRFAATGRFVKQSAVSQAMHEAAERTAKLGRMYAEQLRAGNMTLAEFRESMRAMIRNQHLFSAAAAKGGWAQLTPADYGRIGARVRFHYVKLERLVDQLGKGLPMDGRFLNRAAMYGKGGRLVYFETERQVMRAAGKTQEFNVLGAADHCAGCLAEAARGWVKIGTLSRPTTRECLTNCRCYLIYR